jgi:peptidyl-tRNA hydrolase
MKIFFDRMIKYFTLPNSWGPEEKDFTGIHYELRNATPEMEEWIDGIFTKIVLGVDSLEELLILKNNAEKAGLPVALIEDNGLTEFKGVKTITCIAIGPAKSEQIDLVTGGLKLL